jgi:hypothetical protein
LRPQRLPGQILQVCLSLKLPIQCCSEDVELGAGGRGGKSGTRVPLASIGSFVFSVHLEVAATLATIILHKASSRQGLSL